MPTTIMCGIAGYEGSMNAWPVIRKMLKEMEYRGYDSCGVALGRPDVVEKTVGTIDRLGSRIDGRFRVGIGHTRWATHGEVNEANAHPHLSCDGRIAIVHNGIISNHRELRKALSSHDFRSETDSEVIAHLLEEHSIPEVMNMLEGDFAVAGIRDGRLFAMKNGSPLVAGFSRSGIFLASDPNALAGMADAFVPFEDGEYMIGGRFFRNGREVRKTPIPMPPSWSGAPLTEEHYMLQEIKEGPAVVETVMKAGEWQKLLSLDRPVFIASGSSYNASLFFSTLLWNHGIDSRAVIASEAGNMPERDIVAVSQSGETADVIKVVAGRQFTAVVNVPYSTLDRLSKASAYMLAGRERAVAATKTFIAELAMFSLSASSLLSLPMPDPGKAVRRALSMEGQLKHLSRQLSSARSMYVLGRKENYAIAREIALKIKEIAYIHAEAYESGEMKHGPLALVEQGFPVIVVAADERDMHAADELSSRGAHVIALSPYATPFDSIVSGMEGMEHSAFSAVVGQLISYYMAKYRGLPIDRPRNLAKSVTVL